MTTDRRGGRVGLWAHRRGCRCRRGRSPLFDSYLVFTGITVKTQGFEVLFSGDRGCMRTPPIDVGRTKGSSCRRLQGFAARVLGWDGLRCIGCITAAVLFTACSAPCQAGQRVWRTTSRTYSFTTDVVARASSTGIECRAARSACCRQPTYPGRGRASRIHLGSVPIDRVMLPMFGGCEPFDGRRRR